MRRGSRGSARPLHDSGDPFGAPGGPRACPSPPRVAGVLGPAVDLLDREAKRLARELLAARRFPLLARHQGTLLADKRRRLVAIVTGLLVLEGGATVPANGPAGLNAGLIQREVGNPPTLAAEGDVHRNLPNSGVFRY